MIMLTVLCIIIINIYAIIQIFKLQDMLKQKDQQLWNQQLDMQLFMQITRLANSDLNKLASLLKSYTKASSVALYNLLTKNFISLGGDLDLENYIKKNCSNILEKEANSYVLDMKDASLLFSKSGDNIVIFKFDSKVCMQESTLDVIKSALGFAVNSNRAICY